MTAIGVIFPPSQPPERLREVALAADASGLDELWLWEDCFSESGIATAVAALAATARIRVGIGLIPVPLRNVALTAMELATIERLFPGRLVPGVGHGVQAWMAQVGEKVESPMTLLREYASALQALLAGERLSVDGRYVSLDDVALDWPPVDVPPILVGAVRPKTLALAGESSAGVIFTGDASVDGVRAGVETAQRARAGAGVDAPMEVVAFAAIPLDASATEVADLIEQYSGAGATRVAVCPLRAGGGPTDDSDQIVGFVDVLAEASRLLAQRS